MSGAETAALVINMVFLVMVASALFSRRLPLGQTMRMVLAWLGIFGLMFIGFSFRDEAGQLWQRLKGEVSPSAVKGPGGVVRVRAGEDGHFAINARVNGRTVRFMIDSGATVTAMSSAAAKSAGVTVESAGFPVIVETANGYAESRRARLDTLDVGGIVRTDFPVHVSANLGDMNLLGMNFLSTLKSWRVEGNTLVMEP